MADAGDRRDRRHRRHRGRARRLPLRQPGARRRARQRAGAGRRHRRRRHRGPRLADSKAFDNSILCTNESVLIVEERVADALLARARAATARTSARRGRPRARCATACSPTGGSNVERVGKDAACARRRRRSCGCRRGRACCVAPFRLVRARGAARAREAVPGARRSCACPTPRAGSTRPARCCGSAAAGHSAAIHSRDPRTILAYGAAVPRAAGRGQRARQHRRRGARHQPGADDDASAPGSSAARSLGENLEPQHLVNWTRIAYRTRPRRRSATSPGWPPAPCGRCRHPRASNRRAAGCRRRPPVREAAGSAGDDRPARRDDPARADPRRARASWSGLRHGRAALRSSSSTSCSRRPCATSAPGSAAGCRACGMAAAGHRGRARPGHRAADRRRAQAQPSAGRHPRGRAPVRLPGDPLALDRGRAGGDRSAVLDALGASPTSATAPDGAGLEARHRASTTSTPS